MPHSSIAPPMSAFLPIRGIRGSIAHFPVIAALALIPFLFSPLARAASERPDRSSGTAMESKGAAAASSAPADKTSASGGKASSGKQVSQSVPKKGFEKSKVPGPEILIGTFLGNEKRRFYGKGTPKGLEMVYKFNLGSGQTKVGKVLKTWYGAGWTGQPTLARENGRVFIVIGANDHSLRRIDLETGREVWRYKYDDVIKGSSSLFLDGEAPAEDRIAVLQGSRRGVNLTVSHPGPIKSFRAISFGTGKLLWDLDIKRTPSYSRDNDGSALCLGNGEIFNAGENAIGYFLKPERKAPGTRATGVRILGEVTLYDPEDSKTHGGNLVAEGSPSRLGDTIFVACGSGHVYGISASKRKVVWDYKTGSDMDGSTPIDDEGKVYASVEKEYIPGKGGILRLDPALEPEKSVVWFLPTGDRKFATWQGGVIGTCAINDEYNPDGYPPLFVTASIDGNLYVGAQREVTGARVPGTDGKTMHDTPVVMAKTYIGPSISTPIFTDGYRLIAAGYDGVRLFSLEFIEVKPGDKAKETRASAKGKNGKSYELNLKKLAHFKSGTSFEATPVVWEGKVIVCSKDGYLYVLK